MKRNNKEWSGKSRGGSFGYNFFVILIKGLGVRFAYAFLLFVTIYFIPFAPKATSAIWRYNRRILKYNHVKSAFKLFTHYYIFGQTLIDKVAINNGLVDKYKFEFNNYQQFLDILNSDKGCILIGAHVGCWEIGSAFFGEYATKLNIVIYDNEYQKIKEIMDKHCAERGFKVIPTNESVIESLILMKKALNNEEYLCFQGDRYINEDNIIQTNFMGESAKFPKGPFILAAKFKVPVVFYYSMREKGMKYKFSFNIFEGKGENEINIFNEYIHSLENIVTQNPQQWFNFYKFWK